ncbi:unnamed protein product [Urochloa decumbens]|uniref:F-box domain-containing protein n=1 Tax=Urochloa decumbens TaxID=240449 RepID=A0ABC8W1L1_9POAL
MASTSTPPPASDWAALPRNVLWSIFTELGHHEVLSIAGLACTAWRRLARDEPDLWRRIDLTVPEQEEEEDDNEQEEVSDDEEEEGNIFSVFDDDDDGYGYGYGRRIYWQKTPAKVADDGDLISDNDEISMVSSMKSLRLTSNYDVSSEVFTEVIMKFPLLEELELVLKYDANNYYSTSHLHHFTVRGAGKEQRSGRYYPRGPRSPKPFSIPMMHGLHSFELSGDSSFTNDVVMQIVDNCPNLKSLNISDVRYEDKWELKLLNNKCYRIKDLKLPAVFCEPDTYYSSDEDMS